EPFVTTDLATDDAAYYASFALETRLDDIAGFAIRHPMTRRHVTEDRKHVLLLDRAAFDRALTRMFDSEAFRSGLGKREPEQCPEADVALTAGSRRPPRTPAGELAGAHSG